MRTAAILLAAGLAAACGSRRDAGVRRAKLAAEGHALAATLDDLEDRLLVTQARVRFWREMRERHESVTAISCASQNQHAEEMARNAAAHAAQARVVPARHVADHRAPPATAAGRRASAD